MSANSLEQTLTADGFAQAELSRERPGVLPRLGRQLLLQQLEKLRHGQLRIIEGDNEFCFGTRTPRCDLSATLRVADPQMYADVAFGGTIGAGESYVRGQWSCDDLVHLVRILICNRDVMLDVDGRWSAFSAAARRILHALNRNTRAGSARNISAHYDLGNDLYQLMLDETMAYSCGIFAAEHSTLYEASIAKFDAACRKLALKPTDHLLEIGTGWGGLAIHAAQLYGCRVTTTTISRQQYELARERIEAAGLADRITLLLQDYRDLTGHFDKLVSIEMVEAVGVQYLDTYLMHCSRLLRPDGAMLLQAITLQDQYYERALKSVDFIQRYIFPGSFIPSITAIGAALTRATDMKIFQMEDIGPHYARTLACWRERFLRNLDAVRRLGFGTEFIRLWEFYLCYCEGGFAERQLGDVQMLLTKPQCRREPLHA
ncbi:MAG: cyclopropane-fatty-acyl-phospholipid synthase family protein [Steroidobacteraceae bacterium]